MAGPATAEQVLALLSSHAAGDNSRFASIALQIAAGEAGKGRPELAEEIKRLIDESRKRPEPSSTAVHVATPQGELAHLLAISQPQTRLRQMTLTPTLRQRFDRILVEQHKIEALQEHGLYPRRKLLFIGPPGCGKTLAAGALAGELGLPLCVVRLESLVTKFLGETAVKLRLVFDAIERTRAVYLFDEFDSLGLQRGAEHDVGEMRRVLNSFLVFLEGMKGQSLVIAATNCGMALDHALFRRFDDILEFDMPGTQQRRDAFAAGLAALKPSTQLLAAAARESAGRSFAEIARACEESLKERILGRIEHVSIETLRRSLKDRCYSIRSTQTSGRP